MVQFGGIERMRVYVQKNTDSTDGPLYIEYVAAIRFWNESDEVPDICVRRIG